MQLSSLSLATRSSVAVIIALIGLAFPAHSQTIVKELDFNIPGVLPDADPTIHLFNNTGFPVASIYSVSGGYLKQYTCGKVGQASWNWPDTSLAGGTLDPDRVLLIEARLSLMECIQGFAGAFFQAYDGMRRIGLFFEAPDRVVVATSTGNQVATTINLYQLHTYRLHSKPSTNEVSLYIDGALVMTYTPPSFSQFNGFSFGDGTTEVGNGADVSWDYLRVLQFDTGVHLRFDEEGVVKESLGASHQATISLLSPGDRTALASAVKSIFDDALGREAILVEEGPGDGIEVIVSAGQSPSGPKYGNAGARDEPALVYEGEFRSNPAYTTESELIAAMAETAAHEIGHKLGLQGHNCDDPATLMTAGEKVDPNVRKAGGRLFGVSAKTRLTNNQTLVTAEPKPDTDPNDLAILNGSFCVPPVNLPDDGYLTATGNLISGEAFVEFGYLNSFGEFVWQGDTNSPVVELGSHFDGGFDLAVRSGGTVYSFSNGGGCFSLSVPNPNNPAVSLRADVSFPAVGATLVLDVQNAANTTGGLFLPPVVGCGTASFCTAKTALICGVPAIASTGTPSSTATSGFTISASPARSCKSGILLYSRLNPVAGLSFQGGTLCMPPMSLRRAGSTNSMGTPGGFNCDGEFSLDMNAFASLTWVVPGCDGNPSGLGSSVPAGFLNIPGNTVSVQWWGRDSQGTGSFVSDGLQYVVGP